MDQLEHHQEVRLQMKLDINTIVAFPYDYMHQICSRVMRKFIFLASWWCCRQKKSWENYHPNIIPQLINFCATVINTALQNSIANYVPYKKIAGKQQNFEVSYYFAFVNIGFLPILSIFI